MFGDAGHGEEHLCTDGLAHPRQCQCQCQCQFAVRTQDMGTPSGLLGELHGAAVLPFVEFCKKLFTDIDAPV